MKTTTFYFNLLLILSALTAQNIRANETNESKEQSEINTVIVVTAERQPQDIKDARQSISVLNTRELERISPTHFNELDTAFPNVWVSKGNGQEHLTAIRSPVFTGPGSCAEFLMMENKVPLRAKGFCNVNQLFDSFLSQATQVEVLRGTHSAFYGSDAVHGVINVLTRELAPGVDRNNFLKLSSGDYGYWQLDSLWKTDAAAVKASLSRDGGVKRASGYDQQKVQVEWLNKFSTFDSHTTVSINNLNQETAGYLQAGENAYELDESRFINQFPEAFRDAQSFRLQTQLIDHDNRWEVIPYLRYNDMAFLMHFLPGQPTEKNGHFSLGTIASYSGQLSDTQPSSANEYPPTSVNWLLSFDAELNRGYLQQRQSTPTDSGVAFLDEVLPQGQHYDFDVDSQYFGAQASLDYLLQNQQKLAGGVRYDYLKYDYNNRMLTGRTRDDGTECGFGGCRYTRPADRSDSFLTPSAFITYQFLSSESATAYLKLDKGYRAPQATELYRLQNGQQTSQLEAQNVNSAELSFNWQGTSVQHSVALFFLDKSNVIYQNTDREWVYNAKTQHKGLEWSSRLIIDDQWHLKSNFTFAQHIYTNNSQLTSSLIKGNDIDTAPRKMGGVTLGWSPYDNVRVDFSVRYIGSYYLNPENTEQYDGHTLLNINGQWRLWDDTMLSFKLLNALDKNYADRADFAFGSHRYFVGEPRRGFISFSKQF